MKSFTCFFFIPIFSRIKIGCDASLFRVVKFHDIWVAGPAADAIVLPTTHEEILFFLESSAHTLHNLIVSYILSRSFFYLLSWKQFISWL